MNAYLSTDIVTTALALVRRTDGAIATDPAARTAWDAHGVVETAIPAMIETDLIAIDGDAYRLTTTGIDILDEADLLTADDLDNVAAGIVDVIDVD